MITMLLVQGACYSFEQEIYMEVIEGMLEVMQNHVPKMLRNRKRIGGSYYYNLCEMMKDKENMANMATFMMSTLR